MDVKHGSKNYITNSSSSGKFALIPGYDSFLSIEFSLYITVHILYWSHRRIRFLIHFIQSAFIVFLRSKVYYLLLGAFNLSSTVYIHIHLDYQHSDDACGQQGYLLQTRSQKNKKYGIREHNKVKKS